MYEAFFGLREKPFSLIPDPTLLYLGKTHGLAYSMLEYGLLHEAGFLLITGEIGCGKTTLVRHLLNQMPSHITVGLISNTRIGPDELLRWVLLSLGQPYQADSRIELFDTFRRFIEAEHEQGRHVALIIDEAQNLDIESLEELRMLSNINAGKQLMLQVILVGQPQLRERIAHPDLAQFRQRIAVDFHLGPLEEDETREYIAYRLRKAGGEARLFTPDALAAIHRASGGTPRVINLICDTALVYAFAEKRDRVDARIVERVLSDRKNMIPEHHPADPTEKGLFPPRAAQAPETPPDHEEDLELAVWTERPLDEHCPYVHLVAISCPSAHDEDDELLVAFAVDTAGRCLVAGIEPGRPGPHHGWSRLLRALRQRGLVDVDLFVCEASDELVSDIMDLYPRASWQRDLDTFYQEILERVPAERREQIRLMLKIIHAQGDEKAAASKADEIFHELADMKLTDAATLLVSYAHESMSYYRFPPAHHGWIRTSREFRATLEEIRSDLERVTPLPARGSRMLLFADALRRIEENGWNKPRDSSTGGPDGPRICNG